MDRVTKKHLESMALTINDLTGQQVEPYTLQDDGTYKPNPGVWHIHQGPGGRFSLDQMCDNSSATRSPINMGHIPARELAERMRAFIAGIQVGRQTAPQGVA
jgi:hypothetical protein